MRKPQFASKASRSPASWWKHARRFGKRLVNKSERQGSKRGLAEDDKKSFDEYQWTGYITKVYTMDIWKRRC